MLQLSSSKPRWSMHDDDYSNEDRRGVANGRRTVVHANACRFCRLNRELTWNGCIFVEEALAGIASRCMSGFVCSNSAL